jgi:hypothetical protein
MNLCGRNHYVSTHDGDDGVAISKGKRLEKCITYNILFKQGVTLRKILAIQGGDYEECRLLGYKNSVAPQTKQTNSVAFSPRANYTD